MNSTSVMIYQPNEQGMFVVCAFALFRSKKFLDFDTVALLFLFNKHCLIME